MALQRSLLRIDKASLLETFGSLKIRSFGFPSCLQLLRKSMSNFSLFFLYSSFSYFRKSLSLTFPYFCAVSLYMFIIFLDSTELKSNWIKITTFFLKKKKISFWKNYEKFSKTQGHQTYNNIEKKKLLGVRTTKYHATKFLTENLLAIEIRKTGMLMNKLVFFRFINTRSEWTVRYQFWYGYVKAKYGKKAKLCFMDEDVIRKDIAEDIETKFDTSNYGLEKKSTRKKSTRKLSV